MQTHNDHHQNQAIIAASQAEVFAVRHQRPWNSLA